MIMRHITETFWMIVFLIGSIILGALWLLGLIYLALWFYAFWMLPYGW